MTQQMIKSNKKKMEDWSGSSSGEERGGGGCSPISSYLADQDDQLLDLSDDQQSFEFENRLLLDINDDRDTRESANSCMLKTDSAPSEAASGTTVSTEIGYPTAPVASGKQCVTSYNEQTDSRILSLTSKKEDIFSHGDPTFLNTNLPFIHSGNSHSVKRCPSPADSDYADRESTMTMPSESVEQQSDSALQKQTKASFSHHTVDRGASSPRAEQLPDVSVKQPLLQSQPRAVSECEMHSSTSCGPSFTAGMVIDYAGDVDDFAHSTRGAQAGLSHTVMLDSFPPPPHGVGATDEGSSYLETVAEEIHCHSATSRHTMNDKLARRQLLIVLVLCILFMIGETVGGVLANSLALFTDVLHLASDLISYGISLLALYLSRKQATRHLTFGYHRAEVLGALFSVFIIWLVSGVLCYIAVERIVNKHYMDVKPNEMLITASLGVVFNLVMGFVLHSEKCCGVAKGHAKFGHGHSHSHNSHSHCSNNTGYDYEPLDVASHQEGRREEEEEEDAPEPHRHKNINVRAAFIHVVGDIIQSVGVLVAALIIKLKEEEKYRLADPICTFLFSLLVLCTTINVLRDTLRIIMEGTPQGVDFEQLKRELLSLDSVVTLHNLNVWALTMDRNALSVHLAIDNGEKSCQVLREANRLLKPHNFYHITIQVEAYSDDVMSHCSQCQLLSK